MCILIYPQYSGYDEFLFSEFQGLLKKKGKEYPVLSVPFVKSNVIPNARWRDGEDLIEPLRPETPFIVIAEAFYWFSMSRKEKDQVDAFISYLTSSRHEMDSADIPCLLFFGLGEESKETDVLMEGFMQLGHSRGYRKERILRYAELQFGIDK